jgi:uncharacterized Rmd1/YagE family protein
MKKQGRNRTYHATLVDEVVADELKDIEREIKLLNAKRDSLTQLFNVMPNETSGMVTVRLEWSFSLLIARPL